MKNRPLLNMHVRAPSNNKRKKIKVNKKLIVLFHHVGCLLAWVESTESALEWVTETKNGVKMHRQSDDHLVMRNDKISKGKSTF